MNVCGKNALRSKFAGQYEFALVLLTAEAQRCSCYRGKDPRKPKRFSWSVQGSLRGNRNPLRLFFFCQRFLLEKQKKMLCRSRKFAAVHQPIERLPSSSATAVIFTLAPLSQPPADSSPCRKGSRAAAVSYVFLKIYTLLINSAEDVL